MNASEIIRGITINAAKALGLEKRIGSLHRGKQADIVTLRALNHRWIGYTYGERVVDNVLIGGEWVVRDGKRIPLLKGESLEPLQFSSILGGFPQLLGRSYTPIHTR